MIATNTELYFRRTFSLVLFFALSLHLPAGLLANNVGAAASAESGSAAMTFTSVRGGTFFDPGSWVGGVAPANPIPAGTELIINHRFEINAGETVTNAGHIRILTGGSLYLEGGALINQSGGIFDLEDNLLSISNDGSSIENQAGATFNMTADAQFPMSSGLDPTTVTVDNFGTMNFLGGVFVNSIFTNHPGGIITCNLIWSVQAGASFINQGSFTQTGSTWRYENYGLLDNTGGSFSSSVTITGSGREIVGTDFTHTGVLFSRIDGGNPSGGYEAVGNVNATVHANPSFTIRGVGDNDLYVVDGDLDLSGMQINLNAFGYTPTLGDRFAIMTATGTITPADSPPFAVDPGCDLNWEFQYENGTVYAAVVAGLTVVVDTPDGTALSCSLPELTLDASNSTSNRPLTYFWFHNGASTPSVTVTTPGTYQVRVREGNTSCQQTVSVTVTGNTTEPVAAITSDPGIQIGGGVDEITLDASGSTGVGNLSYLWSGGQTTATIIVTAPGTYSVTVTDDDNGCTNDASIEIVGLSSTYQTVSGGSWYQASAWENGTPPPPMIPNGTTVTVNHRISINVDEVVTSAGNIRILTGGSIYMEGGSIINQSGGVFDLEDNLLNMSTEGSSIENQVGATFNTSNAQFSMSSGLDPTMLTVDNFGTMNFLSSVFINGIFTNHPGGVITSDHLWSVNPGASFINQGSFTQTGVWRYENFGLLDNTGGSFSSSVTMTGVGREIVGTDFTHTNRLFPRITGDNPSGGYEAVGNVNSTVHANPFFNIRGINDNDLFVIDGDLDMTGMQVGFFLNGYTPTLGDRFAIMTATGTITEADQPPAISDPGCDLNWEFQYENGTVYAAVVEGLLAVLDTPDGTVLGCTETELTLDASASSSNVDLRFLWFHNGANTPSVTVTTPGTYMVRVQEGNTSCIKTVSVDITEVSDPTRPTAVIDATPGSQIGGGVTEVTLDASSSTGIGNLTYEWSDGSTTSTITVTEIGTYSVTVTDEGSECPDVASIEITPFASSYQTVNGGSFYQASAWENGTPPPVIIPNGTTVTINHRISIQADEVVTNAGNIRILTGGSIYMEGGAIINRDGGVIDLEDNLLSMSTEGSSIENQVGATFNTANASFTMSSGLDPTTVTVDNFGTMNFLSSVFINGIFTNHPGGIITSDFLWTVNPGASFINQGSFTQTGAWRYENYGLLDNTGGSFSSSVTMTGLGREIVGTDFTHTNRLFPRITGDNPSGGYEAVGNVNSTVHANPFFNIRGIDDNDLFVIDGDLDMTGMQVGFFLNGYTPALGDRFAIMTATGTITEADQPPAISDPGCDLNWVFQYESGTVYAAVVEGLTAAIDTPDGTVLGCNTPELTLDASGSTSNVPLNYLWFHNGANTPSVAVTTPGTYMVRVQEGNTSCFKTVSVEVTGEVSPFTASIDPSATELSCEVNSITLTAIGSPSSGTLSYLWSTGATEQVITVDQADEYSVTITDISAGCTATNSITIDQVLELTGASIATPDGTEVSCITPTLTLTALGGTANTTYAWSNGATTPSIEVTEAETYEVTLTLGVCTETASVIVTGGSFIPVVNINTNPPVLTCETTEIDLAAVLDDPSRVTTYLWDDDNNSTTASISINTPGTYSVTITDVLTGCTATNSIMINQGLGLEANIETPDGLVVNCYNEELTLDATGDTPTTAYLWSTGQTSATIIVSAAGSYSVTVTDGICSDIASVTVTEQFFNVQGRISISNDVLSCEEPTATINVSRVINIRPTEFLWEDGSTEAERTIASAGTYSVRITDVITGCFVDEEIVITEAPPLVATIQTPAGTEVNCNITSVTLDATDANPNTTYLWSNGATTPSIEVSSAGTFTVTISLGVCTEMATVEVLDGVFNPTVAINPTTTTLTCEIPAIDLNPVVGDPARTSTFLWGDGVTTANRTVTTAGTYELTITDVASGCEASTSVVIDQGPPLVVNIESPEGLTVNCNTPTVLLDATDGNPNTTYSWSNGATTPTINVSEAGDLTVTLTLGVCTETAEVTVIDGFFDPIVSIDRPSTLLTCDDPTILLTARQEASTRPTSYQWDDGTTEATRTVAAAGTYDVMVTDLTSGCSEMASVDIEQATAPTINLAPTSELITCTETSSIITAFVDGALGNERFTWSTGEIRNNIRVTFPDTYSVTVEDEATGCTATATQIIGEDIEPPVVVLSPDNPLLGCGNSQVELTATVTTANGMAELTWSDNSSGNSLVVTEPGEYELEVVDLVNGCSTEVSAIVDQNTTPPEARIVSTGDLLSCEITSITLDASTSVSAGGKTYLWNTGERTASIDVSNPGIYTVTVVDQFNICSDFTEITINADTDGPQIMLTSSGTAITCNEPEVTLTGAETSGLPNVSFLWEDGSTNPIRTVTEGGTYILVIRNLDNNCVAEASVTIEEQTFITAEILAGDAELNCNFESILVASRADGGSGNLDRLWSTGETGGTIRLSMGGTYTLTMTDRVTGCVDVTSVTVTENFTEPVAEIQSPDGLTLSCALPSLQLNTAPAPGAQNYGYRWSTAATTSSISVTQAGTYVVTVTDLDNGCEQEASVIVDDIGGAPVALIEADFPNFNCNVSTIILNGSGSTAQGPREYTWNGTIGTSQLTVTQAGEYTLEVRDTDNGCTDQMTFTVGEDFLIPQVNFTSNTGAAEVTCANETLNLGIGNAPGYEVDNLVYSWSNGEMTRVIEVVESGRQTVTITNPNNGCARVLSIFIGEDFVPPTAVATALQPELTCAQPTVTLSAGESSGQSTLFYDWGDLGFTETVEITTPGTYTVTVTDSDNGCSAESSVTVTQDILSPTAVILPPAETELTCLITEIILDGSTSSGQADLTFSWNGIDGAASFPATTPGDNILVVTDTDNGCTSTTSVTLTQDITPPTVVLTPSSTELNCAFPEIIIDASGSTGRGDVSFLWEDGSTESSLRINALGTYAITVTDLETGCTNIGSIDIVEFAALAVSDLPEVNCANPVASLDASAIAGSGDFSYRWSSGGTTATEEVTTQGDYTVTITDNVNGCTAFATIPVAENFIPPVATISEPSTDTLSCAFPTVDLTAATSTGQGELSYSWNQGDVLNPPSNVTVTDSGTYVVTVLDARNGCTDTDTVFIDLIDDAPTASITSADSVLNCVRTSILLDGSGSMAYEDHTLSFDWGDGIPGTTLNITNDSTYMLTVTDDQNGCTDVASREIIEFSMFVGAIEADPPVFNCANDTLDLRPAFKGRENPHSYLWSTGETDSLITIRELGTYSLTVTDLVNGCQLEDEFFAQETFETPDAEIFAPGDQLTCVTPEITLEAPIPSDGGELDYLWLNESYSDTLGTGFTLTVDTAGTYMMILFNARSRCPDTASIVIQQLTSNINADADELDCNNSVIALSAAANGGSGSYAYTWSSGSTSTSINVDEPGEYSVRVTDLANGCSQTDVLVVTEFSLEVSSEDPVLGCGEENTTISTTVVSASDQLTYLWDGGSTEATLVVDSADIYRVTVTNTVTNCRLIDSVEITTDASVPVAEIMASADTLNCGAESITLSATSANMGSGTLSYLWSDASTGDMLEVTEAGVYAVTVTDDVSSCTDVAQIRIEEDFTALIATVSAPVTEIDCQNPTITLTAAGSATGTLTYAWSTGADAGAINVTEPGTYIVTVTSGDNGCFGVDSISITEFSASLTNTNTLLTCLQDSSILGVTITGGSGDFTYAWTGGVTTGQLVARTAGTYDLALTDQVTGCITDLSIVLSEDFSTPTATITPPTNSELSCENNQVTLSALTSTGAGDLSYAWSNGATTPVAIITDPGEVVVTVTQSSNGCSSTASFTITQEAGSLDAEITPDDPLLNCTVTSTTLRVTASGGTEPYTYEWSGAGSNTDDFLVVDAGGQYFVTVTDATGTCTDVASFVVVVDTITPVVAITQTADQLNCITSEITLSVPDNVNYTYAWTGGGNMSSLTVTAPGTYSLVVTDITNGCTYATEVSINEDSEVTPASIAASGTELSCEVRRLTLDATQTVDGRSFSYLWEGGETTAIILADVIGTYSVTITDNASGCENTANIEITGGFVPTVFDVSAPEELCVGSALNVTATATEATSYAWTGPGNFTAATSDFSIPAVAQLNTGTYELVVTKTDGCNDTTSFDLFVNLLPRVEIVSNGPLCTGEELVLEETIGRGFGFSWSGPGGFSNTDASPTIANAGPANAGDYSLTLTDANGCIASDQTTVVINDNPTVDIRSTSPVCKGVDLDLVIDAESSLTWNWTFPDNSTDTGDSLNIFNSQVQEGIYQVEAVNANGCTVTGQTQVVRAVEIDVASGFLVSSLACVGDEVRFVDYSLVTDLEEDEILAALDTSEITWSLGDGRTSNELNPFIVYDAPGTYDISLEIINGDCSYLSIEKTIEVVPCNSLGPNTFIEAKLFPSPSRGNFTIDLALQETSNLRVDLMTPSGKILVTKFYQNRQDITENFQVGEAGIYLVRVRHKYGVQTIKTVVYK